MKQWKRICALLMSMLTMGTTILGAGCKDEDVTESSNTETPHSHYWVTAVTKEATCTEKGVKTKTCSVCGEEEFEEIPAGHSIVKYGALIPTCITAGWDAYEECENCDHTTLVVKNPLGHSYVDGVCVNGCGGKENIEEECTHVWVEAVKLQNPTCSESGVSIQQCENCGEEKLNEIPAAHTLEYDEGYAATCTSGGYTGGYYCTICDYDESEPIPETGHNYVGGKCINEGCNALSGGGTAVTVAPLTAEQLGEGFHEEYIPDVNAVKQYYGRVDVALDFEGTEKGWEALATEYERLQGGNVDVNVIKTFSGSTYTNRLNNELTNPNTEWDIVEGNLGYGYNLQTYCIDMNTAVIGKNAYAGTASNGQARIWREVLTQDAYQTDKSGANTQTYIMNSEGLQTAWFINDVARDAAIAKGYAGPETPETWDELMDLCYYMEEAGYENPLGIALHRDSISSSQFNWLLGVYGDYYYRGEYQNIMLSSEYEYDPEETNPEADLCYGVSANKFFYSIFQDGVSYVGPFSGKFQEFIEQFEKMKPYLRLNVESTFETLRSEFGTQSKGKNSPQIFLDYAGAGLAFLNNQRADFQLDFFDYPVMESEYIHPDTALRDVGGNGGCLSIVKHDKTQDELNLDFMKFVMSPYGQTIYYKALNESGAVPMGMTTVKNDLVVIPAEWREFFQTEKITFNGTVDGNPYLSHFIRGFAVGESTSATLITNWQKYLTGTGADAMDTDGFCVAWENALENDWRWYCATYGKDESLRTDPNGGVAL